MSARQIDMNGWFEINGNPISKVGVYPYYGRDIRKDLDPNKIYMVYRSAEELSKPETMQSFRLLPFTDNHPSELLGAAEKGLVPAEEKGVHGVIGEEIIFEYPFLMGNIKVFSEELKKEINSGKVEVSIGYVNDYEEQSGVYEGQEYTFIQRNIRGNHISLVDKGRSGPEVRVLDHKDNLDEDLIVEEEKEKKTADEGESGVLQKLLDAIGALSTKFDGLMGKAATVSEETVTDGKVKDEADPDKDKEKKEEKKEGAMDNAMDTAEIRKAIWKESNQRNQLAEKLSWHVGTFDASEMSLDEVAKYGIKELGLSCKPGHEQSVIEGYLAGAKVNTESVGTVMDSDKSSKSSQIDKFLGGK